MYTIKNHSLNLLTLDDTGAYHKTQMTKTDYFVRKSDGGELKAQIPHQNEKGEYYYKERDRGFIYSNSSDELEETTTWKFKNCE